jgi:ribonuclease HI
MLPCDPKMRLKIYSDGASRGNPGDSAIAFKIMTEDDKVLKRYSKCIGLHTNNQAEYEALISALKFASKLTDQKAICYLDSELVVRQLNGEYKVKNPELRTLLVKVQELKRNFKGIAFTSVPRTNVQIEEVDRLVNEALDRAGK